MEKKETKTETTETEKRNNGFGLACFIAILLVIIGVGLYSKDWDVAKTRVGVATMMLKETQPVVIEKEQFLQTNIVFLEKNSKTPITENVLIPEDEFSLALLQKIVFKTTEDSVYPLGVCDLDYHKDGSKILDIGKK